MQANLLSDGFLHDGTVWHVSKTTLQNTIGVLFTTPFSGLGCGSHHFANLTPIARMSGSRVGFSVDQPCRVERVEGWSWLVSGLSHDT